MTRSVNPQVPGSSPGRGAKNIKGLDRKVQPLFLFVGPIWDPRPETPSSGVTTAARTGGIPPCNPSLWDPRWQHAGALRSRFTAGLPGLRGIARSLLNTESAHPCG